MIHHLARAFAVRQHIATLAVPATNQPGSAQRPASQSPVRPRPITPWGPSPRAHLSRIIEFPRSAQTPLNGQAPEITKRAVRISVDPHDARRTVITGRFAEVCAALDRLVREQEALA
jgi:hypothetical protein